MIKRVVRGRFTAMTRVRKNLETVMAIVVAVILLLALVLA